MNINLVQDDTTLRDCAEQWGHADWLAVDTEFVRVDTYAARLCLVQVAGPGGAPVCIDTLAVDTAPLAPLLAAPGITKVLHAAGQDLEIFVQKTGDCPRPLFDTQHAAALLGRGEQVGYAAVVDWRLGIEVDKSLSRFDWSRRPLPEHALRYAADDVRHLAALYPALRQELADRGRLDWVEEEGRRLADPDRYRVDPAEAWRFLKGLGRLDAPAQHRAAQLAAWRESEARERDRPRRWILDDGPLLALARQPARTREDLTTVHGLPSGLVRRCAEAIVKACAASGSGGLPLVEGVEPDVEQKQSVKRLSAALREIAEREGVAPTLVATRADLMALVRDGVDAEIPLLSGWRHDLAGRALMQLR